MKTAIVTLASALALGACSTTPMSGAYSQDGLPDSIRVPAGHAVAWETVGSGDITYECRDKAGASGQTEWVFVGPKAVLKDRAGKVVGSTEQQLHGIKKQVEGQTQKAVGDVKEAVKDGLRK